MKLLICRSKWREREGGANLRREQNRARLKGESCFRDRVREVGEQLQEHKRENGQLFDSFRTALQKNASLIESLQTAHNERTSEQEILLRLNQLEKRSD